MPASPAALWLIGDCPCGQACLLGSRTTLQDLVFMSLIRALQLLGDRQVALVDRDAPPTPGPDEVQLQVRAVGLNHIDVWGFRGMACAKRLYPLTVGAESACEVTAVGPGVTNVQPGDRVVPYAAL